MTCNKLVSHPPVGTIATWVGGYLLLTHGNLLFMLYNMMLLASKENLSFIYREEPKHSAGHHCQ